MSLHRPTADGVGRQPLTQQIIKMIYDYACKKIG